MHLVSVDLDRHPKISRIPQVIWLPDVAHEYHRSISVAGDLEKQTRLRSVGIRNSRSDGEELRPRASETGSARINVWIRIPSSQVGAENIVQVPIVNHCSAFEGKVEKSNLASDGKTVWRKLGYVESTGRAGFENQVVRSIVVFELPDITGFKPERSKAANIVVRASGGRTDCRRDSRNLVGGVIEMKVHHELASGWAIEDLGAFKNPVGADVLRISELEGTPLKGPVNEILGGVAGDVSLVRIETLRAVFSKPVPRMIVV
jgi:hypothetical protein